MLTFSVDTHLFTELGELLVGRDSTALAELVKNSYDADAQHVTIFAERLSDPEFGVIRVVDDGVGMTEKQFFESFMRIAGQSKQSGDRRSKLFGRRYTGAKGIGRLAAHKLARKLAVESIARIDKVESDAVSLEAIIDWDAIERVGTLDRVAASSAITVESARAPDTAATGTAVELRRLRRRWTPNEVNEFLAEMQTFQPPKVFTETLPASVTQAKLLNERPLVRDSKRGDPGINLEFGGDFAVAEESWTLLAQHSAWILEIDAGRRTQPIRVALTPTTPTVQEHAEARQLVFEIPGTDAYAGPLFQCRVFCREGPWPAALRGQTALRKTYGIRLYLEGFRVLPYGEAGNDWLGVDAQYAGRGRSLPSLATFTDISPVPGEGLITLPNSSYFGAVFLTTEGAPTLRMLINREGFLPEKSLEELRIVVKRGVDLLTRVRAQVTAASRAQRRRQRAGPGQTGFGPAITTSLEGARLLARDARRLLSEGEVAQASVKIAAASNEVQVLSRLARDLISESSLIRVLASLGTQMAAFIHETNDLLSTVSTIDLALQQLSSDPSLELPARKKIGTILRSSQDVRDRLEKQAEYLVDVVGAQSRRKRMRLSLSNRFDATVRFFGLTASRLSIQIANEVPEDLASPPMFQAELMAVLSNLLSNAIKASGRSGRILAHGRERVDGTVSLVIENTGKAVNLKTSERWFAPYESSSASPDFALGQGTGLGLPITRSILGEYGATVKFVAPRAKYATAVEVDWPKEP